jgi:hypothetical protein
MNTNVTIQIPFSQIYYLSDSDLTPPLYEFTDQLDCNNYVLEATTSPSVGAISNSQAVIRLPTATPQAVDLISIANVSPTKTGIQFTFDISFDSNYPLGSTDAVIVNLLITFINNFTDQNPSVIFTTLAETQNFLAGPQLTCVCTGDPGDTIKGATVGALGSVTYPASNPGVTWTATNKGVFSGVPAKLKFTPTVTATPVNVNQLPTAASGSVQITITTSAP